MFSVNVLHHMRIWVSVSSSFFVVWSLDGSKLADADQACTLEGWTDISSDTYCIAGPWDWLYA